MFEPGSEWTGRRSLTSLTSAVERIDRKLRRQIMGIGEGSTPAADEAPLRAELFNISQLQRHAASLAGWHISGGGGGAGGRGPDRLLPRLAANEASLRQTYDLVIDAVKRGQRVTPAAEWLLDNYHLIEQEMRTARRHLPRGFSRQLPRLANGPSRGYPRVYDIALEIISHVDGRVDGESLRAFVASYQSVTPLKLGELWAIPIMLRLALVENLRRVAVRIAGGRRDRERARYWIERMLAVAVKEPAKVVLVLAEMVKEDPPLTNAFVSEFTGRVHGQGPTLVFPMTWLEQRLAEQGQTIDQVFQQSSQNQAADHVSIGNSIGSLRFLAATEWRVFVESMSAVERTLLADPAGVYPIMDFATRDSYRHAVEDIARRSPGTEGQVATRAIEMARGSREDAGDAPGRTGGDQGAGVDRAGHVGFFLVGKGRRALEHAAGMRPTFGERLRRCGGRFPLAIYGGTMTLTATAATGAILWWTTRLDLGPWALAATGLLLALCTSQLAVSLIHWAATLLVHPRILPRMDFSAGIPDEHRTAVAVPTLLTDSREIDGLLEAMEVRFLANRDKNLSFALLTDFRDAPHKHMPDDEAMLQRARDGIEALNAKYAASGDGPPSDGGEGAPPGATNNRGDGLGGFFLFHRARRFNARQGVWMGWERKRGKLEDFNAALRGDARRFNRVVGPMERLRGVKYVITLDSDTQLPRGSARELAGTLAHPLNRPRYDEKLGRVTDGYTILQPRVGVSVPSANRSRFARLFSGDPGIDPYTRAVSDVYQDVFAEGSFIGKGIYDVDAFERVIGARFPENRILSHDLLEGAYARAGLVSDVVLFEDFPSTFAADASRRYRWVRGDWQVLPWLMPWVPTVPAIPGHPKPPGGNPLSWLSQWKILDNLRRSLVPIALLALLLLGWFLPGAAIFYTMVVVALLLLPALWTGVVELYRRPEDIPFQQHGRQVAHSLWRQTRQQAFAFACLPYEAFINADAIARTAIRVLITGRRLLEWRTARDAEKTSRTDLPGSYVSMWVLPAMAAAAAGGLAAFSPAALPVAGPVIALWFVSPGVAYWLSLPLKPAPSHLSQEDLAFLGAVARRTWRFFETFVGPIDNYLPPDNFQEDPPQGAAHRTSPTNIGLSLLASLGACDFGYITAGDLIGRTTRTLDVMDKLQRYRGHFYNWYDTRTLAVLQPPYVSTVDSGNLAGHLLTLAAGLNELAGQKIFRPVIFKGLGETLDVLLGIAQGDAAGPAGKRTDPGSPEALALLKRMRNDLASPPRSLSAGRLLLQSLLATAGRLRTAIESHAGDELKWWTSALDDQCRQCLEDLDHLAPWAALFQPPATGGRLDQMYVILNRLDDAPTLAEAARLEFTLLPAVDAALAQVGGQPQDAGARDWINHIRAAVMQASERAATRLSELRRLAVRCGELADVDYDLLYDKDHHLLATGFNVGEHRLDTSFYDLLASEARLASFIAIAQGKLPQEAWFYLGRQLTVSGGHIALLSWSGSMFEYLMPMLVMPAYQRTLLDATCHAVVARQIEYGRQRGVAWGISESGYAKTNAQLNYMYRAFGVPGLGFKRGLADDLVVAPYASALALMVAPGQACANLRRLAREGVMGAYGFYEAVDYTASRLPQGKSSVTVRSFMAHHQGMVFLSLTSLLLDKPMQRRFESDPAFQATDLLLQERVPMTRLIYPRKADAGETRGARADSEPTFRVFNTPHTPAPEVHLLSNGRYHVAVTAAGGGYSRWRDLAVTRWHEDATRDHWGTFCYLRDVESAEFWSVAHQPTLKRAMSYEAVYSEGRAEFRRRDGHIDTHVEVSVSPEDDIELRRISITNRGRTPRTIELTSYAEVVLAPPAADAAHPAFSNLFVQTELLRSRDAILCTRRPRSNGERPPWMIHLMTVHGPTAGAASFETGRAEFIGRGRSLADPDAMHRPALTDSQGAVLDPIVAIRNAVVIRPDETVRVHLVIGVTETRDGALALVEKYHDPRLADRVFELAAAHSRVALSQLDATEAQAQIYGSLAGHLLYAAPRLRAPASVIARNRRGQSGLWSYGISGDLPIVLLRIADLHHLNLVRQLAQAHAYWRVKGLAVDLVIWNEDQSVYRQEVHDQILTAIASGPGAGTLDKPGGIFVRRFDQMSEEDKVLMQAVAHMVISDTGGTLTEQLGRLTGLQLSVPRFVPIRNRGVEVPAVEAKPRDLAMFNGLGGFTQDGREYVITTTPRSPTPAPWVNVLANPWFGAVVSESGGAYTWCENAHSYRLTPWNNDPVSDASGEAFYVRDEETGRFWSPTQLPAGGPAPYTTRHGFGYTVFEHAQEGVESEMSTYVAMDAPVKFIVIKLRNASGQARRLSLTGFFELVLGERRPLNAPHVVTEIDLKTGALLARNNYNSEFAERVAFLDASEGQRTVTGDRAEFLGRNGSMASPACMTRARLSGRVGAALDPCAAMQVIVDLPEHQERQIAFIFGSGIDLADARHLVARFHGAGPAHAALEGVWDYWKRTLGAVYLETPDTSLNFLANGWLLYQVLACRFWARTGFYQSGGAFGFRDQLQDAMALVHAQPGILREHLLRAAGRQFPEGDVQHWWHPPQGRGVRTRISDDFLWLPYAVCRYVAALGDTGVLDEKIPFLDGRPLKPEEESYYDLPARSATSATLYEHCVRAIRHGLRLGEHGLPLMGAGDWNDGMNLVGAQGKGQSVWLAFFLYDVLVKFAAIATRRQDNPFAELCASEAAKLRQNIEQHGWDGQWYRRAYFDDGRPLGSASNPECQIDSLPQSWAVLSGAGDAARSRQALESLDARLVNRGLDLVRLFDPPFDKSEMNPGYVKGYVPGVRENGGQYTHAAVWAAMAFAAAGDAPRAWELFDFIDPVRHGYSQDAIAKYKVEPYVLAADVYANPQHAGRGGWTWYTGSAGWMYRLITESLLGLRLEADTLRFTPCLPAAWREFKIHYRYRQTVYHITVHNSGGGNLVKRVSTDGQDQVDKTLRLIDDHNEHEVDVEVV